MKRWPERTPGTPLERLAIVCLAHRGHNKGYETIRLRSSGPDYPRAREWRRAPRHDGGTLLGQALGRGETVAALSPQWPPRRATPRRWQATRPQRPPCPPTPRGRDTTRCAPGGIAGADGRCTGAACQLRDDLPRMTPAQAADKKNRSTRRNATQSGSRRGAPHAAPLARLSTSDACNAWMHLARRWP
jgi:hypothetical protein